MTELLSREAFRAAVFARDGHRCLLCGRRAADGWRLDAHHIIEKRLWRGPAERDGYFLDNGATLCDDGGCHLRAEMTLVTATELRVRAGITHVLLPEHLYTDQPYTKWGDPVLPDGTRLRGELFFDESVQKVLAEGDVLRLYRPYVRHPRTYHLPYSGKVIEGDVGDDKVMADTARFHGQRVIVTAKMDGSQCTIYHDYLHGRSPEFQSNVTWHWLQNYTLKFRHELPAGWRLNLENLWGGCTQAIQYQHLPLYTMAFMLWDERNVCLSWDETVEWCALLGDVARAAGVPQGLPTVPVLYDGIYDEARIASLYQPTLHGDPLEGFVVRIADAFAYAEFPRCVGKYVRHGHRVRHGGELLRNTISAEE
jgi:hypothetical protein